MLEDVAIGWFVLLGFVAQLFDGAVGMAYGTLSSAVLLAFGLPPALVSASVNSAKIATNGVSSLSHAYFRNVDRRLFFGLVLPAMAGAVAGALLVTHLPERFLRPAVSVVLLGMGVLLLWRAWRKPEQRPPSRHPYFTATAAGFVDATTGGFGPVATTGFIMQGVDVRKAVGTGAALEFFVALTSVATLLTLLGHVPWRIIGALILGGLPAAPLAAYALRIVPARVMMLMVGSAVIALSAFNLWRALR